jgi:hypothetical protein
MVGDVSRPGSGRAGGALAGVHVSRILAKLGVTGRGEAAAVAYRLTLAQRSALAGDGDVESVADLTHPFVAESADALDERPDRHALD